MRYALNSVPVNGSATLYGSSAAAAVVFGASGFSTKQKKGTSLPAAMVLDAIGSMRKALAGSGTAGISLDALGVIKQALAGRAAPAGVEFAAKHGIPSPMPPRSRTPLPNQERMVIVNEHQRVVVLPIESRAVVVPAEQRAIKVLRELEPV